MVPLLIRVRLRFPANRTLTTVNGGFLHWVVLLVNPLTDCSIHNCWLKYMELFLHWPYSKLRTIVTRDLSGNLPSEELCYEEPRL